MICNCNIGATIVTNLDVLSCAAFFVFTICLVGCIGLYARVHFDKVQPRPSKQVNALIDQFIQLIVRVFNYHEIPLTKKNFKSITPNSLIKLFDAEPSDTALLIYLKSLPGMSSNLTPSKRTEKHMKALVGQSLPSLDKYLKEEC